MLSQLVTVGTSKGWIRRKTPSFHNIDVNEERRIIKDVAVNSEQKFMWEAMWSLLK